MTVFKIYVTYTQSGPK